MEIALQPKLRFLGVNILNIQFTVQEQLNMSDPVEITIDPKVYYPEDSDFHFSILMNIELKFKNTFFLTVSGAGNFVIEGENNPSNRKLYVNANAPAIMFPYMRSFISTLTINCGNLVNPIIIPPHFFNGEMEEFKFNQ
jgi:preprotein translocase subunit SecB